MDSLDGRLDLFGERAAYHKDFLNTRQCKALKCPVEQRRVTYGQQALLDPYFLQRMWRLDRVQYTPEACSP